MLLLLYETLLIKELVPVQNFYHYNCNFYLCFISLKGFITSCFIVITINLTSCMASTLHVERFRDCFVDIVQFLFYKKKTNSYSFIRVIISEIPSACRNGITMSSLKLKIIRGGLLKM